MGVVLGFDVVVSFLCCKIWILLGVDLAGF